MRAKLVLVLPLFCVVYCSVALLATNNVATSITDSKESYYASESGFSRHWIDIATPFVMHAYYNEAVDGTRLGSLDRIQDIRMIPGEKIVYDYQSDCFVIICFTDRRLNLLCDIANERITEERLKRARERK